MSKGFEDLPTDEQKDVVEACKRRGVDVRDFDFHDNEVYPEQGVGPIHRSVVVFRKGHDQPHAYDAGIGSSWTVLFADDLMKGVFD